MSFDTDVAPRNRHERRALNSFRMRTTDAMESFDQATRDSAGSFLVSELERLDPILNQPLVQFTWSRDCPLRDDVTMADDYASFTNSTFGASGWNSVGKNWSGKNSNAAGSVSLDIGKTKQPLNGWELGASWNLFELVRGQHLGRPIDADKIEAVQMKWNMDLDEQVYVGDSKLGLPGLLSGSGVAVTGASVTSGTDNVTTWAHKILSLGAAAAATLILADINNAMNTAWLSSGYTTPPDTLILPAPQYSLLVSTLISSAGNQSILKFVLENNITMQTGKQLKIVSTKWNAGSGVGGADRMLAYTNSERFIRIPVVPLQRTPLESRGLDQSVVYYGMIGQVEFRYPETLTYMDGI